MYSQRRHRHFIRPCTNQTWPTCIVAVEAICPEMDIREGQAYCGESPTNWIASTATFNKGERKNSWTSSGETQADFWRYIDYCLRHNNNMWVVSWHATLHALILGLWEQLENRAAYLVGQDPRGGNVNKSIYKAGWQGYAVLQNPPTIICFKRLGFPGTVTWIDMKNFGLSSMTQLADGCTLPERMLGTLTDIMSFLKQNGLGSIRTTTGSQALYSWKFRFLRHTIHVSTDKAQNDLGQAALYGGRNECFRLGQVQGQIAQYDINSLYPSVYSRYPVPVRCREHRFNPSDSDIAHAIRGKNCIARVAVETDVANVPRRSGIGLTFPIGRISTVLAWPELEIALDTSRKLFITEIATFDLEPSLSDFADELYPRRCAAKRLGNEHIACYIKSLLVSLPGKFGQRQKRWQISDNQTCSEPWHTFVRKEKDGTIKRCRSFGWAVEDECEDGLAGEAVPEIAAWVNSWGRRILWEWTGGNADGKTVYVDTDSKWTIGRTDANDIGATAPETQELGKSRLVGTYQNVEFLGLKHYIADGMCTPARNTDVYDQFGRWLCTRKIGNTVKPYLHGRVQADLTVKPLIAEDW